MLYLALAIFGGLWVPVEVMPDVMRVFADWTPAYWAGRLARTPLLDAEINIRAVLILTVWAAGFALVAVRRFRLDTARA